MKVRGLIDVIIIIIIIATTRSGDCNANRYPEVQPAMAVQNVAFCEGLRMSAHEGGAAGTGGRRTQTSKGGNRGRIGEAVRQTLWGFRRRRSVVEVC